MRPRYEELFRYVRKELHRADVYDLIAGGVVLTGGAALAPGLMELAEEVFEVPARLGVPAALQGLDEAARNPLYATGVGLLLYAHAQRTDLRAGFGSQGGLGLQGARGWVGRVRGWLSGHL